MDSLKEHRSVRLKKHNFSLNNIYSTSNTYTIYGTNISLLISFLYGLKKVYLNLFKFFSIFKKMFIYEIIYRLGA